MKRTRVSMNAATPGKPDERVQLVKLDRFGYVRVRHLFLAGTLGYVLLTGLVTVITSDLITLAFLGLLVILALALSPVEEYFPIERRVIVYVKDGIYLAEHLGTGITRHGSSEADALAYLDGAI